MSMILGARQNGSLYLVILIQIKKRGTLMTHLKGYMDPYTFSDINTNMGDQSNMRGHIQGWSETVLASLFP